MRWRIPLVLTLIAFVAMGCSDQSNPTAVADDVTALSLNVAADGGIACSLPFALPDRWSESGGPGNDPMYYNPESDDYYIPWPDPYFTGFSPTDIGIPLLYTSSTWYYRWLPPGQHGQKNYRENISSCVDPSIVYTIGDVVDIQRGGLNRQALEAFQDLISSDPTAYWHPSLNCVTDATAVCRGSTRLRPIPIFAPNAAPDGGSKTFTIVFFAAVFVERIEGNALYVRFAGLL